MQPSALQVDAAAAPMSIRVPMDHERRRRLFLLLIGLPALLYVVLVALLPLAQGLWYSLFDYNLTRPAARAFVGLQNYRDLWADGSNRRAIVNTFGFTIATVAIELVLGMGMALLLWADSLFNRICLSLILIPVTITPLAVALLFRALLEPDFGLLGYAARVWGLSPPSGFLASPATAMATLIFIDVWQWTPLMALILLAGLKALPEEVMEAAAIDGATPWQKLTRVVLPMMSASVLLAIIMRTMDAFKIYDSVLATTGGGPNDATNVLMFAAAKTGLEFFEIGSASAISSFMLLCIAALTAIFIALMRRIDRDRSPKAVT
ncbi:MAG: permease component of ABC-type sugar transporter [Rhizobacter sp.]|nr:permease component of ABC-type sugar transporter [Rhizobacter sp.]